jgi:two-component system, NtrC family, sensor kinase
VRPRSKAGGKPVKTRRRKTVMLKRRKALKAASRRSPSPASQDTEVARLTHELTEAVEQQAATSDVLNVISQSTYDLQTVLNTLVETAARICGADMACIVRPQGSYVQFLATYGFSQAFIDVASSTPIAPGRWTLSGRVLAECRTVQIADVLADQEYTFTAAQEIAGFRSGLGVPLVREGTPIGVLNLWRSQVQPFTDKQIALVTNFAAQAVIAIENTRLLNELRQSLEQQTATSEVLRVISSSATNLQPVFETIVHNSVNLCGATYGIVYRFDGEMISFVAHHNLDQPALDALHQIWPMRPDPRSLPGRTILERDVLHVVDVAAEPNYTFAAALPALGVRTFLGVPMLREGQPIEAD